MGAHCTLLASLPVVPQFGWNDSHTLNNLRRYWTGYEMMWSMYWHYGVFGEEQRETLLRRNDFDAISSSFITGQKSTLDLIAKCAQMENESVNVVVEQGCGLGANIFYLADKFSPRESSSVSWIGLDIDRFNIRHAQEVYKSILPEAKFCVQSITSRFGEIPDSSVDIVYSVEVFCALNLHDKLEAFREAYRILRPGGKLVFTDVMRHACSATSHPPEEVPHHCEPVTEANEPFMKEFHCIIGFNAEIICIKSVHNLLQTSGFTITEEIDLSSNLVTNYEFAVKRADARAHEIASIMGTRQRDAFHKHYSNARKFFSHESCCVSWRLISASK
eukprot:TRINITY_DN925_c0_g1_i2.p1 TRINITY_DN925_c0_g1~~TRINITY_DN925_c0_g1_i2.p1  ORF type:complete len:332 (-),score=58.06 TRINITY_DN925_c0_g1_i2:65-1060(-)